MLKNFTVLTLAATVAANAAYETPESDFGDFEGPNSDYGNYGDYSGYGNYGDQSGYGNYGDQSGYGNYGEYELTACDYSCGYEWLDAYDAGTEDSFDWYGCLANCNGTTTQLQFQDYSYWTYADWEVESWQEDSCWTDVGAEICMLGEGELSVCAEQLEECWYGEYDAYGFMVGDEEMRGMICDWEGECVGNHAEDDNEDYNHDFFQVTGGEVVYPIQIDWIEDIAVDTIHAYLAGNCEWNGELSEEHDATVVTCQYGDEVWHAGYNLEGFGAADESRMILCSWEGDCFGFDEENTFCSASWEEIEC